MLSMRFSKQTFYSRGCGRFRILGCFEAFVILQICRVHLHVTLVNAKNALNGSHNARGKIASRFLDVRIISNNCKCCSGLVGSQEL